jgi:hypothetical protein
MIDAISTAEVAADLHWVCTQLLYATVKSDPLDWLGTMAISFFQPSRLP